MDAKRLHNYEFNCDKPADLVFILWVWKPRYGSRMRLVVRSSFSHNSLAVIPEEGTYRRSASRLAALNPVNTKDRPVFVYVTDEGIYTFFKTNTFYSLWLHRRFLFLLWRRDARCACWERVWLTGCSLVNLFLCRLPFNTMFLDSPSHFMPTSPLVQLHLVSEMKKHSSGEDWGLEFETWRQSRDNKHYLMPRNLISLHRLNEYKTKWDGNGQVDVLPAQRLARKKRTIMQLKRCIHLLSGDKILRFSQLNNYLPCSHLIPKLLLGFDHKWNSFKHIYKIARKSLEDTLGYKNSFRGSQGFTHEVQWTQICLWQFVNTLH